MISSSIEIATLANSAVPVEVPDDQTCVSMSMPCLRAVTQKTRMVFIANPNNPDRLLSSPHDEMRRLHAGLPPDTLMVIDAAYANMSDRNDYEAGIELVPQFDNVVMTRTFSKVYGLAGMRIGWAYAPAAVCRRAQPHPRSVQCLDAAAAYRRGGDRAIAPMSNCPSPITRNGRPG